MNILHHKSWHVRNKDNILRVRRDEAKAAADEKEKKKRSAIAESEARLEILRAKSSKSSGSKLVEYDQFLNQGHVNLFEQEELGKFNEEKNPEVELEKKQEKEKFEKKIGLLNYLVDDNLDLKKQPWYQTVHKRKTNDESESDHDEIDLKRKQKQDPMSEINELFKDKEKKKDKKHKKAKHRSKSKERDSKSVASCPSSSKKTIEQLRAERLKRENEERLKADRLLAGVKNPYKEPEKIVEKDDRKRRYNSQFNPEFNRFNKDI